MIENEYIKKVDALNIVKRTSGDYAAAFADIRRLPATDMVKVVHCSGCQKWNKQICEHHGLKTEYYDFCSYGERKMEQG